jgi:DNA polymerase elongation subunit (family B)
MHFGVQTFSGKFRPEDPVTIIKVRYKDEDTSFQNNEEKCILESFPEYLRSNDPDIIVYTGNTVLQHLFTRAQKLGLNLQLGREDEIDYDQKTLIMGRIHVGSSRGVSRYSAFDDFGLTGLIERSRFAFLPLELAAKYSMNRLIDSRNCYELIQRGFVIPKSDANNSNNHERIRTVEELVSRDKGSMIISPQIGLHENVVVLDYDSEYANLIVNHNISYETVTPEGKVDKEKRGLLPTIVDKFLKRRDYFKALLKELAKESTEYLCCEQRVSSLKNILVCLYGTTGSIWNRHGNVLAFEEINRLSREGLSKQRILFKAWVMNWYMQILTLYSSKDKMQQLGGQTMIK